MNKNTLRFLCAGLIVAASAMSFGDAPITGLEGSASAGSLDGGTSTNLVGSLGEAGSASGSLQNLGSTGASSSLSGLGGNTMNPFIAPPVGGAPEPFTLGLSMAGIGLAALRRAKARR